MELSLFVIASDTCCGTTIKKTYKCCDYKNNDDIQAALSGIMANDPVAIQLQELHNKVLHI